MGLLNLMLALLSGASRVLMVDLDPARLERAKALGASQIFNASAGSAKSWVRDATRGRGVDVVITATPVRQVQTEAIELLAPFGRLCLFAGLPAGHSPVELDTNAVHYKNLVVTGMTGGSPHDYRMALKLIESGRVNVTRVVSHVFPLREVARAYEVALSGKGMKVLLAADKWVATVRPEREPVASGAEADCPPVFAA